MANNNTTFELNQARYVKKDEFYTRYETVAKEMDKHAEDFKDKIVYCNCDGLESNFTKYFRDNMQKLQLKALYISCLEGHAYKFYPDGTQSYEALGDGSYDSWETRDMLREADMVITNPPFSTSRAFLKYMVDNKKKFAFLGPVNMLTNNFVGNLIIKRQLNIYWDDRAGVEYFTIPHPEYLDRGQAQFKEIDGVLHARVKGIRWVSNIWEGKHHPIQLTETYSPEKYPKYDSWDCIEVSECKKIPIDYKGYMGVPITYIDFWDKEKFDIVAMDNIDPTVRVCNKINGEFVFRRIIIKAR